MEEFFPLVDKSGRVIGNASRSACHCGSKLLHPVIHLHVFNSKRELLLQKRSIYKDIQPAKWDTSVGGHVDYGETIELALQREAYEELRIASFNPIFFRSYIFESNMEKEKVYSYYTIYDGPVIFDPAEIDEIRFWTLESIEQNRGRSIFTPNFEQELDWLLSYSPSLFAKMLSHS